MIFICLIVVKLDFGELCLVCCFVIKRNNELIVEQSDQNIVFVILPLDVKNSHLSAQCSIPQLNLEHFSFDDCKISEQSVVCPMALPNVF